MKIKIKQILLAPLCAVIVIAGVATFAAFEAHVINVTAKIENALAVSPEAADGIQFGTVFPQEYLENDELVVKLSTSFTDQTRVNTVNYKIVQKPKPIGNRDEIITVCNTAGGDSEEMQRYEYCLNYNNDNPGYEFADDVCTSTPLVYYDYCYQDLCRFLSKMKGTDGVETDTQVLSYLTRSAENKPESCATPIPDEATGQLTNSTDVIDNWIIDLNVPPVNGSIGQDWPDTCADWTVPAEADYGCDLWIEVTGINI